MLEGIRLKEALEPLFNKLFPNAQVHDTVKDKVLEHVVSTLGKVPKEKLLDPQIRKQLYISLALVTFLVDKKFTFNLDERILDLKDNPKQKLQDIFKQLLIQLNKVKKKPLNASQIEILASKLAEKFLSQKEVKQFSMEKNKQPNPEEDESYIAMFGITWAGVQIPITFQPGNLIGAIATGTTYTSLAMINEGRVKDGSTVNQETQKLADDRLEDLGVLDDDDVAKDIEKIREYNTPTLRPPSGTAPAA